MTNYDVKQNLRALRKNAKMTQLEMAKMLGIKRTTYRNIESGATKIINEHIIKAAEILQKPVETILAGYENAGITPALLCERDEESEKEIVNLQEQLSEVSRELSKTRDDLARARQSYCDLKEINQLQREILEKERALFNNYG